LATRKIAKAIEEMGHTGEQTLNALVLREKLDRLKVEKLTMTRDKFRKYVNNWKKDNDFFLCNALGDWKTVCSTSF
jgi:hypothetical protein